MIQIISTRGGSLTVGSVIYKKQIPKSGKIDPSMTRANKCNDGPSCSMVDETQTLLLVEVSNCDFVASNRLCRLERQAKSISHPGCYLDYDEDPLLSEYVFASTASYFRLGVPVEGLSARKSVNCDNTTPDRKHPLFSRVLVTKPPGESLSRHFSGMGMTIDRFKEATNLFIKCLSLIKSLHFRGIVHGNLSDNKIHFFDETKQRLVLSGFESARFYPTELGTPPIIHEGVWEKKKYTSLYQLRGNRYGRRDDIFRLFEAYAGWMIGPKFWSDMSKFSAPFKLRVTWKNMKNMTLWCMLRLIWIISVRVSFTAVKRIARLVTLNTSEDRLIPY